MTTPDANAPWGLLTASEVELVWRLVNRAKRRIEAGANTSSALLDEIQELIDAQGVKVAEIPPDQCPRCGGKGVGIFTNPGDLTYSGACTMCKEIYTGKVQDGKESVSK